MSRTLIISLAIGLAVIAVLIAGIFYMQRGSHIDLHGKFLKVRTAPLDEHSSVVVIDYRIENPADFKFMAQAVTVTLEDKNGNGTEGQTAPEPDARQLFANVPLLGEKYNESFKARDFVAPHSTADRMVAARFEVPEAQLQNRKRFAIRIDEIDGAVVEFAEK
ncbi:MAG: hypothetical protein ABSH56_10730 [Bryobacteraceae bacterium]|jgi:hypothetical protein